MDSATTQIDMIIVRINIDQFVNLYNYGAQLKINSLNIQTWAHIDIDTRTCTLSKSEMVQPVSQ